MPLQTCVVFTNLSLGWRIYMEDAHIATQLGDQKLSLFGVFDGHGGTLRVK